MVGRSEPVTFFGYPDHPSQALPASAQKIELAGVDVDLERLLTEIADHLGADTDDTVDHAPLPEADPGPLDTRNLGAAFAAAVPEGAIVLGESISSGGTYRYLTAQAAPHTLLGVLGGAIGGGLPSAIGAAIACPDRPVLALQADGSSLYTVQSLWTMAREALDVTTVICANRRYQILDVELANAALDVGAAGRRLTDLGSPDIDFVKLGEGFGVPGRRATTGAELIDALDWAAREPGPHLIEAEL
ncbi:MAG: thiamine pyrophosphate-dependent enzyme [Acidimicrobiales bacterium]